VEASYFTNGTSSIGKKFYVRINFIKLILQKIGSSTCKGDKPRPQQVGRGMQQHTFDLPKGVQGLLPGTRFFEIKKRFIKTVTTIFLFYGSWMLIDWTDVNSFTVYRSQVNP